MDMHMLNATANVPIHVLLVDGDVASQAHACVVNFLQHLNFEVTVAVTSSDALQMVNDQPQRFQIVMLDLSVLDATTLLRFLAIKSVSIKHRKKRGLLQAAPRKARVPNAATADNASVPTQMLDPGWNFGGSNIATFSGPQEEAPAPAPAQDNLNDYWAELLRDCPLII
ncbi:hypothetical protein ACFE04_009750 [Oxalis oulophora]